MGSDPASGAVRQASAAGNHVLQVGPGGLQCFGVGTSEKQRQVVNRLNDGLCRAVHALA